MGIELTLLSRVAYRGAELTGARLGGLLALLAGEPRTGCGTARLVAELWPDGQPEHPTKALQVLVARARTRLGPDVIVSTPTGYRLALRAEQVDASAVPASAAASERCAGAGDHAAALRHAEEGLALCAGAEGWDAGSGDPLAALRAARAGSYRSLVRARALALSRLGRAAEAVGPLRELAAARPRDEEVLAQLLRCEAATEGPGTALARYDAYRRGLREELGGDPGPALRGVHRELLATDAPVVRRGVRHEPNSLLGRDRDVAAVAGLLATSRVTSVVGPGGLGKTRLAHAVARRADQRVVHLVELAGVTTDADVTAEIASALGVTEAANTGAAGLGVGDIAPLGAGEEGRAAAGLGAGEVGRGGASRAGGSLVGGIVAALGAAPALLVLDNCEHVVRGVAGLVQALVGRSGELRVLVTSRAPLGVSSEAVYLLPQLDVPAMVELFRQRAAAVRPGAELPAATVRELCGRLDGLPLAAELAAARARVMSVTEIARRLDDRFALLRGGPRDAPTRHRTLQAVIDWSWHLLGPAGQAAMRALSVFPGGFTADAARALLGGDAILEELVDQSLLAVSDSGSVTRFAMLETVREFSTGRRDAAGDTDRVVDGFLRWVRELGLRHHGSVLAGDVAGTLRMVRAEQDNLVQALRYGLDRADGGAVATAAALLAGLWLGESNFSRLVALARDTAGVLSHYRPGPELLEVTRTAAVLCALSGFLTVADRPLRPLVTLRRLPAAEPDTLIRAAQHALSARGVPALLALCDSERPLLAGVANYVASYVWEYTGEQDLALRQAHRMLDAFERDDSPLVRLVAHGRMGELCLELAPGEPAYRHLRVALELTERLGWWVTAARGRWALVLADLQRGAFDEAERELAAAQHSSSGDGVSGMALFEACARAEILLGRGDIDAGLLLWRQTADRLRGGAAAAESNWVRHAQAVAVVTHARFGRLELATGLTGDLPAALAALLAAEPPADLRVCGSLLLALSTVDLDRGAAATGVRLVALAERFGMLRSFHPTMSPDRAAGLARQADGPAYADAVSEYAGLDHAGLRAAALAVLRDRVQLTAAPAGTALASTGTRPARDRRTTRRR